MIKEDFLKPLKWRQDAKIEDFRNIRRIGHGAYGDVF
jgi:hypothetical protein